MLNSIIVSLLLNRFFFLMMIESFFGVLMFLKMDSILIGFVVFISVVKINVVGMVKCISYMEEKLMIKNEMSVLLKVSVRMGCLFFFKWEKGSFSVVFFNKVGKNSVMMMKLKIFFLVIKFFRGLKSGICISLMIVLIIISVMG